MGKSRLAIFDFDGTLADSIGWFFGVVDEIARRHGLPQLPEEERQALRGKPNNEVLQRLGLPAWRLPVIARDVRRMAERDIEQIRLFPWVGEVFDGLRQLDVTIAVVSSNIEANIRRVMGPEFASAITHWETGVSLFGKSVRLKASLRACGAGREESAFIGDETRDVEAARKAGIASLAVAWGYAKPSALAASGPTRLVQQPTELLDWFASRGAGAH